MTKRLITALLASLLAVAGLASPARAAASDCAANTFCIWTSTGFAGSRYQFTRSNFTDTGSSTHPVYNGIRLTSGLSNHGWSFYNRLGAGWSVNIYDAADCSLSPWYRTMVNGQQANASGSDWGGRVSSIQLTSASPLHC